MTPARTLPILATLLICGLLFGCGMSNRQNPKLDPSVDDSDRYRGHEEMQSTDHGVTEVGLERSECFGTCPVYKVFIKNDGTFTYTGESNVPRLGIHTGKIDIYEFDQLARFMKDSKFMDLEDDYSRLVTDLATAVTSAVIDGKRKVVRNYANAGPTQLWAVEQLIDKLLLEAQWDDDKPAAGK